MSRRNEPGYRARMELIVGMTDLDVLEKLQRICGGNVHIRNSPSAKPHWKQQWVWRISGKRAIDLAERFRPHLCARRTARLDKALADIEATLPQPKRCACCREPFTPDRFSRQQFCSQRCWERAQYLKRRYDTIDLLEAVAKGYKISLRANMRTHCPSGHELAGSNVHVYRRQDGRSERRCRACSRDRWRAKHRPDLMLSGSK